MSTLRVKIDGVEKLQKALGANFKKVMADATLGIAHEIEDTMSPYPAQRPPVNPRRWYVRGWGPRWHSNPARRPKSRRGGRHPITYGPDWAGYHISETLGRSWGVAQRGTGAIVGNRASYAPAVQHHKEQASVHEQTGWITDKQAVDRVKRSGAADRIVQRAVKKALGG